MVAKADHLPVGLIAMKVERLERENRELARQRRFLVGGQETGTIAEPFRQDAGRAE
jgi:hypothetical protein